MVILFASFQVLSQAPDAVLIQIVKAEDARRFDDSLDRLIKTENPFRSRASLAAGRIGDEKAVPSLSALLDSDAREDIRTMAAFALGEIESLAAADVLLKVLSDPKTPDSVRARAVEAAGKVGAASQSTPKAAELGVAILETLDAQDRLGTNRNREVVLQGITAALRLRPQDTNFIVARFLDDADARIRADAANTLSRVRATNAKAEFIAMLGNDPDAVARATAARALGSTDDKKPVDQLLTVVNGDPDERVRVSAIRSIAALRDVSSADGLIDHGTKMLNTIAKSKQTAPAEINELLEIATALGRLKQNTEDQDAVVFINKLRMEVGFTAPETEIAMARVAPKAYVAARLPVNFGFREPSVASAYAQGLGELASLQDRELKGRAAEKLMAYVEDMKTGVRPVDRAKMARSMPDLLRALAAYRLDNVDQMLREHLGNKDVFIRAAAAELIAARPSTKENVEALKAAFSRALVTDKDYNDAQLGIMDALVKLDKGAAVGVLLTALNAPDYLVRKKAFELLADPALQKQFPGVPTSLESARKKHADEVRPYSAAAGTKLGQLLYTDADYRRALARKNGAVKAVLTTDKGTFTIDLAPEDAPLTVDNFIKLARSKYFNGVEVHRVVPNFVMQDGDPRGDGNGGPGWSIRCEINMLSYERGAVGMALSGKDTGGSQWFVTHSPQPHLDGGYTVFGRVNEKDMKVVDNIVRGDKIISVAIVENGGTKRGRREHASK